MTTPSLRLVVDTNIFMSGSLWRGTPGVVLDWIAASHSTIWFNRATFRELVTVLSYPKFTRQYQRLETSAASILQNYLGRFRFIQTAAAPLLIPGEPLDNELVAVARAAQVDALISGDQHLLKLVGQVEIPILTPAQFVHRFCL